ncbi:hypothetical protein FOH10_19885 [Nocardia otitidiscaviarum]|uniref:Uncharacterized protein n=1 Tax=Nocardia otitidiscaviarum TaxID=1823 RepID=A0A516NP20_9NOCA|nr:hypothetical protein [Nocardia otitidiscaviarum]MCP9624115.1 hypothetical protein [Nocardia otitidiscaviarum]QDP80637.1 hypothetical protein FOH10_19885 [Nocardia otitidiscaviarum]
MHLKRGLRASMRNNGQAYGFSVSITAGAALLNTEAHRAGAAQIFLFAMGAVAAFSLLEAVVSTGFRQRLDKEPSTVMALGVSLSFLSVGATIGVAWVVARFVGGTLAWPLAGFLIALVYPLLAGLELAIAQRARAAADDETPEEGAVEREDDASDS